MILAALAMLGSSFVAAKAVIETVPTFLALSFRLGMASLILVPILIQHEHGIPHLRSREWSLLTLQGLFGVVFFNIFLFYGLERTSAGCAGITFGMLPIVVGLLAWMFLREKMTGTKAAAIACAAIGTIQLSVEELEVYHLTDAALGNILIVAAVCCEGIFTILGKQLTSRCSPLSLAALLSVVTFVMVFPFAVRDAVMFDFSQVSMGGWSSLVWWALASGVGYFFLFHAGLSRVEATMAGISTVALPLTTLLLASWLLREPIGPSHIIGIGCAVTGILMIFAPQVFDLRILFRTKRPPTETQTPTDRNKRGSPWLIHDQGRHGVSTLHDPIRRDCT